MKLSFEQGIAAGVAGLVAMALIAGVLLVDHGAAAAPVEASAQIQALPAPTGDAAFRDDATHASVVFAGGCFWGVQGVFQHVKGVSNVVSGYIGGSAANARYERVSGGQSGHAEAVKIDYDPRQVSYGQLMQVFFSVAHDPTQLNRQGPDHGSQYRSAIFSDDARQQAASRAYIAQLGQAGSYRAPIVTQLVSGQRFYPAESYHQNYMTNYPQAAYIRYYDAPKLAALARQFPALYRREAVLVPMR
ncbi:peptide-methionine (S)-S-oxide reductase MsrA [Stenotrophomonas sepilia]|uniref:Peptide methionine sulfoxide reductase MsrA n=1 Tax=Stenotrophomonas sepilia TaxID=2860290 RepID=A0ABQ6QHP3_9GAMM|nr:peptide-methionine (S)-S-oxide reductase MsrA [Stenotrophomonas maltophilia]MCU1160178.1 peptide-methionine (S)-S-oxide reductase MsrA [Stenotrophomonas maltophilia]GMR29585.1 peptide-methionine (S)-S-oxide reductase MsrA [Stenotrophomonas sepilia]